MKNTSNFFKETYCMFKACKEPKRKPDYISYIKTYYDHYEELYIQLEEKDWIISSKYWYGKDKNGKYVIRSSGHWSKRNNVLEVEAIRTCYWELYSPRTKQKCIKNIRTNEFYAGKAYLSWFKIRY